MGKKERLTKQGAFRDLAYIGWKHRRVLDADPTVATHFDRLLEGVREEAEAEAEAEVDRLLEEAEAAATEGGTK